MALEHLLRDMAGGVHDGLVTVPGKTTLTAELLADLSGA
jgi:hypothetical protein